MSRESWQNGRVARNFPDGVELFLPPEHLNKERARMRFASVQEQDFNQFVANRNDDIDVLDRELRIVVPRVHRALRTGMEAAVQQGYVPAAALKRIEPAFTQTAIQAVDQSRMGGNFATYEHSTDIMRVGTEALKYNLSQIVAHEIGGHKISGGTFVRQKDGTVARVRRGFVNYNESTEMLSARHSGLDEAVQHHLVLSYLHGQIDTLDPSLRDDSDTQYYEHRKLLAAFIDLSGGIIDFKAITRGSFEDTDETGAVTTDRRTMVIQARTAYGAGAYHKLSILFDSIDFDELSAEDLAERIHPPSFNGNGSILAPGYIDTDNLTPFFDEEDI